MPQETYFVGPQKTYGAMGFLTDATAVGLAGALGTAKLHEKEAPETADARMQREEATQRRDIDEEDAAAEMEPDAHKHLHSDSVTAREVAGAAAGSLAEIARKHTGPFYESLQEGAKSLHEGAKSLHQKGPRRVASERAKDAAAHASISILEANLY